MSNGQRFFHHCCISIVLVLLSACIQSQYSPNPAVTPTISVESAGQPTLLQHISPTATHPLQPVTPTAPSSPMPKSSSTLTPLPKLSLEGQEQQLGLLLRTNGNCLSPCFWGIVPNQTTLLETQNFLAKIGLELTSPSESLYALHFDYTTNLTGDVYFTVREEKIVGIKFSLFQDNRFIQRNTWAAYTPENILGVYGVPSAIHFFLSYNHDVSTPENLYYKIDMLFIYDDLNLIILYAREVVGKANDFFRYCPGQIISPSIGIWIGKDAHHPPSYAGALLEDATSLSRQEFYQLITENPGTACIDLKAEAFKGQ